MTWTTLSSPDSTSLSLWGSPWVVHGAVLQLRRWYHSDGHTVRAKNSLTKILTSLMWGHTRRETHTLPHSGHRSCSACVCGREHVWRVVGAGDRAGRQSEMISEPEREAQIKLVQCQYLGVKRAGRRPALSFQAPGTLAQAEQASALAPGHMQWQCMQENPRMKGDHQATQDTHASLQH